MKTQIKARRIRRTTPMTTNLISLENFSLSPMQEIERVCPLLSRDGYQVAQGRLTA
jgi:hypothetical protein